ncbi:MAG: META domain-containing protein [Acidimicrobiia bacterium]
MLGGHRLVDMEVDPVVGVTLDGVALPLIADRPATLMMDGVRVTGSTGCNTYHATISTAPGGVISLSGFSVTEIGCEPGVMDFEARLLAVLRAVDRFAWDANRLTLGNDYGSVTLDLMAAAAEPDVALDVARWLLTGITSGDTATSNSAGNNPFLVIEPAAGAVRGNGGCNDFGADVTFDRARMLVSDMVYTEIACDEATMLQEAEYFRILAEAATWQVKGDTLIIATNQAEDLTFTTDGGEPPEGAALAWIMALASSDLDAAAALMGPASIAFANERGGLAAFSTELAEGWGAWAQVDDRRVWSVTGRFPNGTEATAVVLAGTVTQEGMTEQRSVSLVMVEDRGAYLVHPFTTAGQIGLVVPRTDFVDRVAPDVPFELAIPKGFEVLVFLDESGPRPVEINSPAGGQVRVTAEAEPLPQPGDHILTVIHLTADGEIGAQAVSFTTYP